MIKLSLILVLLETILLFLKSLDFIYLFQIKEYRFDRFMSSLFEEGFITLFYKREFKFPAKKLRNYLLAVHSLIFSLITFLILQQLSLVFLIFVFLILPLLSFMIVSFGVVWTEILAQFHRRRIIKKAKKMVTQSKAAFIGITGSYGKTTTKELLYQILSTKYEVAKTEANMNSEIGVAISIIKNLKPETEIFIAEIGAYRIGEIASVCQIIHPKYGILTSLGNQHLSLFGSKENLIKAKLELVRSLPKNGKAYINQDILDYQKLINNLNCPVLLYSKSTKSDISAQNINIKKHIIHALINYLDQKFEIEVQILGRHNISNLLPCIALAFDLKFNQEEIIKAIRKIHPIENKLSLLNGIQESTIIQDSNNSNVEGFIASIETVKYFPQTKKIILSRGIIELGDDKHTSYQKIIQELNKSELLLFTTDKLFKAFDTNNRVSYFSNEDGLLQALIPQLDKQTLIVLEGKFTPKFIQSLTYATIRP